MHTHKGFTINKVQNGYTIHDPLYPVECQNVGVFYGYFDAVSRIDEILALEKEVVPEYRSHHIFKKGSGTWQVFHCVGTVGGRGEKFASIRQAIYFIDKVVNRQFNR